jgi:hypothetical protein
MKSAEKNDPDFLSYFKGYRNSEMLQKSDSLLHESLIEFYRATNTSERVDKNFEPYVRTSVVSASPVERFASHRVCRSDGVFVTITAIADAGLISGAPQPLMMFMRPDQPV